MYPSGRWRGYWEQTVWGRQPMENLNLRFQDGTIEGEGTDVIGSFVFHGGYDEQGSVWLTKAYPSHIVMYQGTWDGEGTIYGMWSIGEFHRGPFALSPEGHHVAEAPIRQLVAHPPDEDES